MTYDFEIICVKWHHNRGDFIFARHLGCNHDFDIPDGSLLGDTSVYHYAEMQRLTGENADTRPDLFVFRPTSMERLSDNHFSEGQKVKLIVNDKMKSQ